MHNSLTAPSVLSNRIQGPIAGKQAMLPIILAAVIFSLFDNLCYAQTGYANNEDICDYINNYKLVYEDEFNSDVFLTEKWTTWFPFSADGSDQCVSCRASNTSVTLDERVLQSNGQLNIQLKKENVTWYGHTRDASTGAIFSRPEFNEGKFEIRCMIPGETGMWPAFWLFGGDQQNEIDIFEFCGEESSRMRTNIHRVEDFEHVDVDAPFNVHFRIPLFLNDHRQDPESSIVPNAGFHTYAVEWLDDWIIWYFDGIEQRRMCRWQELADNDDCTLNGPYTGGLFIPEGTMMNLIVSAGPGDGQFCSDFNRPPGYTANWFIDYVRVYQNIGAFSPGLSNVCATTSTIQSSSNSFCVVGDEIEFQLNGPHGDPVTWVLEGNGTQSLEIVEQDNNSCTIRCLSLPGDGYEPIIAAYDPESPCPSGTVIRKTLYLGRPLFEGSGTGDQNLVEGCPEDDAHQYWSIQCQVRGAEPINPAPVASFTRYYPALETYNEYDQGGLDEPIIGLDYSANRPYQIYVDGEEQTRTFLPEYLAEYAEGYSTLGSSCEYLPLECQEHWITWGNTYYNPDQVFSLWKDGDFCHDIKVVAQNGCGTAEWEFTVRDDCYLGDCDFLDPNVDLAARLGPLVTVSPVPASDNFTISFAEEIDMDWINKITVRDVVLNPKYIEIDPKNHAYIVNCSNWGPGLYYVIVEIKNEDVLLKVQIK